MWQDIFWLYAFLWQWPWLVPLTGTIAVVWWWLTIKRWQKPIQKWLDERVPPEKKEIRMRKTLPGVKLYACLKQHYKSTVVYETPFTALVLFVLGFTVGTLVLITWWTVDLFRLTGSGDPMAASFPQALAFWAIQGLVAFVGVPLVYHRKRWIQRNFRLFFTSQKMIRVVGKIGLAQIFKLGTDYLISETDIRVMDDILIAPDPQDLQPRFRTSRLRDVWTKYWAGREDVASVYIPARAFGGADFVTWLEGAIAFDKFRDELHEENKLFLQKDSLKGVAVSDQYRTYVGSGRDLTQADLAYDTTMKDVDVILHHHAEPVEFDLFSHPAGIWPEGWGQAESKAPKVDEEVAERFKEFIPRVSAGGPSQGSSEPKPAPATPTDFHSLWASLSASERRELGKAGLSYEMAGQLHERFGVTPKNLLEQVRKGFSKEAILARYPLFGTRVETQEPLEGEAGILPESPPLEREEGTNTTPKRKDRGVSGILPERDMPEE